MCNRRFIYLTQPFPLKPQNHKPIKEIVLKETMKLTFLIPPVIGNCLIEQNLGSNNELNIIGKEKLKRVREKNHTTKTTGGRVVIILRNLEIELSESRAMLVIILRNLEIESSESRGMLL